MDIFQLSKGWPVEEKYSLTDQVRRSSRSVCANLREAWAKRRYEAHFISKLTDADGENSETNTWLDFALDCRYLNQVDHRRLTEEAIAVGSMLGAMLTLIRFFCPKTISALGPLTSDFWSHFNIFRPLGSGQKGFS